jgi:hypothetical protein
MRAFALVCTLILLPKYRNEKRLPPKGEAFALHKNPAHYLVAVSGQNENATSPFTQIFLVPCNQVHLDDFYYADLNQHNLD